jgi:hypothetical protein
LVASALSAPEQRSATPAQLRLLTNANNFVGYSELTSSTGAPSRVPELDFAPSQLRLLTNANNFEGILELTSSPITGAPSRVPELDFVAASSTDIPSRISEFDFAAASVKRLLLS